jgi:hypothetical protein
MRALRACHLIGRTLAAELRNAGDISAGLSSIAIRISFVKARSFWIAASLDLIKRQPADIAFLRAPCSVQHEERKHRDIGSSCRISRRRKTLGLLVAIRDKRLVWPCVA